MALPLSSRLLLLALVGLLVAPLPARADDLDDIRQTGTLRWGGDQEGGGPYIYPRDDDPSVVTGFEVEMAAKLATYLKARPEFTQAQWDKLPEMLRTRKVHVVLNGYEFTPERLDVMDATIPYFVYGLQLLCKKDGGCQTWDDLRKPRADGSLAKIGVLTGSAAQDKASEFCGEKCEVIGYDGTTDAMREVETGKLDATLQDTPIVSFYLPRFPGLQRTGEPVAPGYYVLYVRKGETRLVAALNEALILLLRNGDLEAIYKKYGLWDKQQQDLVAIAQNARFYGLHRAVLTDVQKGAALPSEEVVKTSDRPRGWKVVQDYGGILLQSAGVTVLLAILSFPLAIALGMLVAVGRLYGPRWLALPLGAYVEFLRGTPVMLQLYFIFFFLPEVGLNVPAFWTGVVGLAVNYSAYESEIYRAGLQAIPGGQLEAALSLGMSRVQAVRRILVPQAFRMVIPPVVNDFIALFKDTSVCSVVTIVELTKRFSVLSLSTQATIELMALTGLLYLLMSYPLSLVSRHVERRLGVLPVTA